ncbi:MAG: pyridoxal-phosphate dependent enzyme [Cocleimonas sp.]|nr:pyridoxal-phosphate dependent enzyme [Cocleimonas sp.]
MNLSDFNLRIEAISLDIADKKGISLLIARADQVHPLASGNKLYKLFPNIEYAKKNNYQQLLSFGGAFSNHIHALALYSQSIGLQSVAIIRGEKEYASNPTLSAAVKAGMVLQFVDRATYRRRYDKNYLKLLQRQYPHALIIPEGGSSELALQGCTELMRQINHHCVEQQGVMPDVVTVACGTGMTFSGIVIGAESHQNMLGYLVLKDYSIYEKVDSLLSKYRHNRNYIMQAADFGGYAKLDADLLNFILNFLKQTDILLDPIYTSKMCRCVMQQIEAREFVAGSKVLMVHSGGLQAWYGMKDRVIRLAGEEVWKKITVYL